MNRNLTVTGQRPRVAGPAYPRPHHGQDVLTSLVSVQPPVTLKQLETRCPATASELPEPALRCQCRESRHCHQSEPPTPRPAAHSLLVTDRSVLIIPWPGLELALLTLKLRYGSDRAPASCRRPAGAGVTVPVSARAAATAAGATVTEFANPRRGRRRGGTRAGPPAMCYSNCDYLP